MDRRILQFESLKNICGLKHGLVLRNNKISVNCNKAESLHRLRPYYEEMVFALGFNADNLCLAEQIHGNLVSTVDEPKGFNSPIPKADGLITFQKGVMLGVFVADCCAVLIADRRGRGVSIVHSGKAGSELGIVKNAIRKFNDHGIESSDLIVQLSPCIRPPAYEIDFPATIITDCLSFGVPEESIFDVNECTSLNLEKFYSYRAENGKTGRLLGLIGIEGVVFN
jgi:hypothetical protein